LRHLHANKVKSLLSNSYVNKKKEVEEVCH